MLPECLIIFVRMECFENMRLWIVGLSKLFSQLLTLLFKSSSIDTSLFVGSNPVGNEQQFLSKL
jgi:hypothetical protein